MEILRAMFDKLSTKAQGNESESMRYVGTRLKEKRTALEELRRYSIIQSLIGWIGESFATTYARLQFLQSRRFAFEP